MAWRGTSLQNGHSLLLDAIGPTAAANSLLQSGQVEIANAGDSGSHIPSMCEAKSKAQSKLMRDRHWQVLRYCQ